MCDVFEAKDRHNGLTPLHYASRNTDSLPIEILLACNVSPNIVCKNGYSALHYVAKRGYEKNCKVVYLNS